MSLGARGRVSERLARVALLARAGERRGGKRSFGPWLGSLGPRNCQESNAMTLVTRSNRRRRQPRKRRHGNRRGPWRATRRCTSSTFTSAARCARVARVPWWRLLTRGPLLALGKFAHTTTNAVLPDLAHPEGGPLNSAFLHAGGVLLSASPHPRRLLPCDSPTTQPETPFTHHATRDPLRVSCAKDARGAGVVRYGQGQAGRK